MTLGETSRMTADSHGLSEDINGLLFSMQAKYMLDLFCYFQEWFQYVFLLLRMSEEERKLNTAARIVAVGVEFATSSPRCLFSLLTQQHKACMRNFLEAFRSPDHPLASEACSPTFTNFICGGYII